MGGNGTFSVGKNFPEVEKKYWTVFKLEDNIFVVQNKKGGIKLPEESHTPGRIYVLFNKNGSGIHEISIYGEDHKKIWAIHTADHHGIKPHMHYWKDGGPFGEPFPLTPDKMKLLDKIKNLDYGEKK